MTAGLPGALVDFNDIGEGWGGGRAILLQTAVLQVADVERSKAIHPKDKYCAFVVELQAGETELQTSLLDQDGDVVGAYYIYVTRI